MRTSKEIEAEIAAKKKELENLEKELKRCDERWKPEYGSRYYYANIMRSSFYSYDRWNDSFFDSRLFSAGLIRPTPEEAEELGKRIYYLQMFASMSDVTEEDWKDGSKPKHFVLWNYQNNTLMYDYWRQYKSQGVAYFSSEDRCREAVKSMISAIGDENFKRYVLGVRHNES